MIQFRRFGRFLESAMDRGSGFVRTGVRVAFQQLGETGFVKITDRTFAVGLDPFRVLGPEVFVNLKLKRGKRIDRVRSRNQRIQGSSRAEHSSLDKQHSEIVQIDFDETRVKMVVELI